MARGKFSSHRTEATGKHSRTSTIISNILLLIGSSTIVVSLVYLLFNLDKSDALVNLLMPIIFAGIGFLIVSQLICPFQFKMRR